ncbi:MAG: helix-turn-helix transcriptional regulator [Pseudomonadota bacterium]|nr:helix-turn-helix transcriptional regulator [Pseudomonadota bacterium]
MKTPHIDISIRGEISPRVIAVLRREYGHQLVIDEDDGNDLIKVTDSDWYQNTKTKSTPGDALRIYRENHNLTQKQLGEKLGHVQRQIISNMERGKRTISLATAKKLAAIFNVPANRFLDL